MDDDLTDRRLAEQALRASEARLLHIVEHAQDLIYSCDANGRFTYVNPTAARVLQYDVQELIGRHFLTLIRDDHRNAASELYRRQMAERTRDDVFRVPGDHQDRRLGVGRPARAARLRRRPPDRRPRDCPRHLAPEGRRGSAAQVRSALPRAGPGRGVRHLPHDRGRHDSRREPGARRHAWLLGGRAAGAQHDRDLQVRGRARRPHRPVHSASRTRI